MSEKSSGWYPSRDEVRRKKRDRTSGILSAKKNIPSSTTVADSSNNSTFIQTESRAGDRIPSASILAQQAAEKRRRIIEDFLDSKVKLGLAVVAATVIFLGGCGEISDANFGADEAAEFLHKLGYEDVRLEDTDTFLFFDNNCGRGDFVEYEFEALTSQGEVIKVDVCKGLMDSPTLVLGG
jgi:hypothetical protein